MKIGFYLNNIKYESIDMSSPEKGNPGIGGIEYKFTLVSYFLAKNTKNEVYVFAHHINNLPSEVKRIKSASLKDALDNADKESIDFLICRSPGNKEAYLEFEKHNCKIIIWACNFAKYFELNLIAKCEKVVKYVCLGKEHLELLNGHPIYKKSTYINNPIVLDIYKNEHRNNSKKSLCYVGAIIESKGFDICCKVWHELREKGYDIDFNIIGSGRLYNPNKKLGKYNIAIEEYENKFISYITGENGELLDGVHFYGVLSHEDKVKVMSDSYVGISASKAETFGQVAIEFAALGIPFVAKRTTGYSYSVNDKSTGFLARNDKELHECCKKVLNFNQNDYLNISNNGKEFVKDFNINRHIEKWEEILDEIKKGKITAHQDISILKKITNIIKLYLYIQ